MVILPEELVKLDDEKLKKELSKSNSEYQRIYQITEGKIYKRVTNIVDRKAIYKNISSNYTTSALINSFETPLTYSKFKEIQYQNKIERIRKVSIPQFAKILNIAANTVIDKDNFEISIDNSSESITMIIRFPDYEITNGIFNHRIRDLFVKLDFFREINLICLNSIKILRTTYTEKEIVGDYMFSHCSDSPEFTWVSGLCLGHTNFSKIVQNFKSYHSSGEISTLTSFLLQLVEYFKWESLDGVPYKKIEGLNKNINNLSFVDVYVNRYVDTETILEAIFKNTKLIDSLRYTFLPNSNLKTKNYFEVRLNQDSIDNIDDLLTSLYPEYKYIRIDGESYIDNNLQSLSSYESRIGEKMLTFKNKDYFFNIIKEENISDSYIYKIDANILDRVVNSLEKLITKSVLQNKLMEEYNG